MLHLPAECEQCGKKFPSGIAADEVHGTLVVGDVAVKDVVDRCPRCGGRGRVANGPAQEAATTVMLRSSEEVKDIQALILILDEMRKRGLSRDQVADHIEQKAPRFTALKIFLPSNAGELYGFLGFLTGAAVFFTLITVLSKVQRRTLDLFEK